MAIIIILSDILFKKADTISSLFVSAIVIITLNPFSIFDIGFILSFGGTLGIVLLNPKINTYLTSKFNTLNNSLKAFIIETLSVTISAQIIILPIMCYSFNSVSVVSLLANLVIAPLIPFITIVGILMYIFSIFSYNLSMLFAYPLNFSISLLISISIVLSSFPYAMILVPSPTYPMITIYYLLTFYLFKQRSNYDKYIKYILYLVSIIIIISLVIPKNHVGVNFIDIGQGDSTLIRTTKNHTILIDGGGSEQSDYDVGEKVLLPFLLKNGIISIDVMVISHFHEDHVEGLITVLEKLKVNKIIIGLQGKSTELLDKVLSISSKKNIQVCVLKKDDKIVIDDIILDVLFPNSNYEQPNNLNNNSLIIKAKAFDTTILFTGDMEVPEEEALLREVTKDTLKSTILKVGHHGSKTSSSKEFLLKVSPSISIISCGVNNKFGHPNKEVVERLKELGTRIYRTDLLGQITIKVQKNNKISISHVLEPSDL
jgi:competence protein ComEC